MHETTPEIVQQRLPVAPWTVIKSESALTTDEPTPLRPPEVE